MLSVKKLKKLSEVYQLPVLLDQHNWVVTPNPNSADIFRQGLAQHSLPALEVMTISSLTNKLMGQIANRTNQRKSKSELLALLATIWKIKGQDLLFNSFLEIFELFTELRSFSIETDLFDEVLNLLPGEQGEVVSLFWKTIDEMNVLDEHAEVATLAANLKSDQNLVLPKGMVIWGFNHLNGNQIDLIKSLALWVDVEIPIHERTYNEKKSTDYLSWLDPNKEAVEEELSLDRKPKIEMLHYGTGRLAESLKVFLEWKKIDHIVLSEKKISQAMRMEIPLKNLMVKTDCDLFLGEINRFKEFIISSTDLKGVNIPSKKIRDLCQTYKSESIKDKKSPNFRAFKIADLFENSLLEYEQLSTYNETLNEYDIEVLLEVVSLDQPRAFLMPVGIKQFSTTLYSLNQIQEIPIDQKVILCISSQYNPILRQSSSISFEMSQKLSAIGPLQNPRLEYLTYKMELLDLFERNPVTLLLESELEESDLGWKEIFDECDIEPIYQKSYRKRSEIRPWSMVAQTKLPHISASRLQMYKECPRKYYHNYIEPFQLDMVKEHLLEARELGEIEHKVIELATKANIGSEAKNLMSFIKKILDDFLEKNNKILAAHQYRIYQDEIFVLAKNGLSFVESLTKLPGLESIEFEVKLENIFPEVRERGSIDLLVKTTHGLILIDFKRSSGSIPTGLTSLVRFEKIQLWFYLKRVAPSMNEVLGFGYLNLSDPENSLLISPDDHYLMELNESLNELGCKFVKSKNELEAVFDEYRALENDLVSKVQSDQAFRITPEDETSCNYCNVSMICPRRDIESVQ